MDIITKAIKQCGDTLNNIQDAIFTYLNSI